MTYSEHLKNVVRREFSNRSDLATFAGMIAAIFSIGFTISIVVAVASVSFSPILALLVIFGVLVVMCFVCFFSYTFVYWTINVKER